MKPPPFEYYDPTTIAETVSVLRQYGDDAKVLAGGQSLMPLLNFRLARPAAVVDIPSAIAASIIAVAWDNLSIATRTPFSIDFRFGSKPEPRHQSKK